MPQALGWVIPAALGAIGLIQNANAQKSQNSLTNAGVNVANLQGAGMQQALNAAETFDPAQQDRQAFQVAGNTAQQQLTQALQNLNARFTGSGGSPSGDTAFTTASLNTENRVLDPLRTWMASQVASEPQRQLGALESVYQAPAGQLANTYFNAAAQKAPSAQGLQGSIEQFMQGIGQLLPGMNATPSTAATGTGLAPIMAPSPLDTGGGGGMDYGSVLQSILGGGG